MSIDQKTRPNEFSEVCDCGKWWLYFSAGIFIGSFLVASILTFWKVPVGLPGLDSARIDASWSR